MKCRNSAPAWLSP